MSLDLAPIENAWQLMKMKLRNKTLTTDQSLVSTIKHKWKVLLPELPFKLVHNMENRIFEVVESHGDFILHYRSG